MLHPDPDHRRDDAGQHPAHWSRITTTALTAVVLLLCIYALLNGGLSS